jgi:trans-2,3-dihydro-3-hydroxyanthranilate isomerase
MSRTYRYQIVDVFTDRPFGGNQLAVVLDADGLADDEMQAIAREFNFSETTFVLPPVSPGAAKRVRIFTPGHEMPFAGHPTVGTTFVLHREGIIKLEGDHTEAVLDENIGPVVVRLEREGDDLGMIWMQHRSPQWGTIIADRAAIARILGLEPGDLLDLPLQIVSTGVPYLLVGVRDIATIRRVEFDARAAKAFFAGSESAALYVWTSQTETPHGDVHGRMFWHDLGSVFEDPATGSANGPLGAYVVRYGVVAHAPHIRILSEQGFEMGRPSYITIDVTTDGDRIADLWIAGRTVPIAMGTLTLPG